MDDKYYTRHRSQLRKKRSEGKTSQSELEGIALAETVAYVIEDDSDGPFYTIVLAELYKTRLKELGGVRSSRQDTHTSFPGTHSITNTMDEGSEGW